MSQSASGTLDRRGHSVVRFDCDVKALYVKRVSLGTDDDLSMAVLGAHPHDENDEEIRIERVWDVVGKGQRVTITARPSQQDPVAVLHGWIVGAQIGYGGRIEDLEYTVLGLDWGLRVEKVFGSWSVNRANDSSTAVWLRAVQAVFNKDGKYNKATADVADSDGNQRVVFDLDDDLLNLDSAWWNGAAMARYLVSCERKGELSSIEGRIFPTTYQPAGEIADFRPFDVNAEGMDIWSGLVNVARRCTHGVRIRYAKDRAKPELVFFTRKLDEAKTTKQLEIPPASLENVTLSDPMRTAAVLDVQHDLSGIVRQFDCVTPPKLYESTWELMEGWTLEAEQAAFGEGSVTTRIAKFIRETDPQTSSDWEQFKYVGRRFILNETGRDDTTTPDVGPFDFSRVFGSDSWAVHLRPFRHSRVSTDEESGTPKPVLIHVDFGSPFAKDVKIGNDVAILPDRAGIYFKGAPMVNVERALASGNHEDILPDAVTVEAVVEGDQDAPHNVNAIAGGDDMPVPTFGLVRLDDGYRQDNINDPGQAREIAEKLVNEAVEEMHDARLVGTAVIPWITFAFEPGDVIDNINGRDLKVKALVAAVRHDVMGQATELALEYSYIDTSTHARVHKHGRGDGTDAHGSKLGTAVTYALNAQEAGYPADISLEAALRGASPERTIRNLEAESALEEVMRRQSEPLF